MSDKTKIVLLADDDAEDCMLATEAFVETGANAVFECVRDGMELMAWLSDRCCSESKGLPDLILLDLDMPLKDGLNALIEIKSDPVLRHIPVVILSTSEDREEAEVTMKAGADWFITKPATFDGWVEIMKSLAESWLGKPTRV